MATEFGIEIGVVRFGGVAVTFWMLAKSGANPVVLTLLENGGMEMLSISVLTGTVVGGITRQWCNCRSDFRDRCHWPYLYHFLAKEPHSRYPTDYFELGYFHHHQPKSTQFFQCH